MNIETNLVIALLIYIFAGVVVLGSILKRLRNIHVPSWDKTVAIAIAFTYNILLWPLVLVYIHKNISFSKTTLLLAITLLIPKLVN